MPCGVVRITGIPGSEVGGVEQDALSDGPLKVARESAGGDLWNLTVFYDACADETDPISVSTFPRGAPKVIGSAATTPGAFVSSHLAATQVVKQQFGVPISVTLAQSALESGWGRHVVGNAYFGVKAESGQPSVTARTREVVKGKTVYVTATFRSYASFAEAALGYGSFLRTNHRYQGAFNHLEDPEAFARAVADAGFASDLDYAAHVIGIMRDEKLEQYDRV